MSSRFVCFRLRQFVSGDCSKDNSEQRPRFSTCSTGLLETLEILTLKLDGVLHSHEADGTGCLNHGKDCSRLLKKA